MPQITSEDLAGLADTFRFFEERLQEYLNVNTLSSEQHAELGTAVHSLTNNSYALLAAGLKNVPAEIEGFFPEFTSLSSRIRLENTSYEFVKDLAGHLVILSSAFANGDVSIMINAVSSFSQFISVIVGPFFIPDTYSSSSSVVAKSQPPATIVDKIQDPVKKTNGQYWLIKLDYTAWDERFKQGVTDISYTTYKDKKKKIKRPGYPLFLQLKTGDKVVGYGFGDTEGIMCLLEVTGEVQKNPEHGEIVVFQLIKRLDKVILLSALEDIIPFTADFKAAPDKRLFKMTAGQYAAALALTPEGRSNYISAISTDAPSLKLDDAMDFESDWNALAAIIAYRQVQPPLAIGLFGNWGTGKSFFMNKLREKIEKTQEEAKKLNDPLGNYCAEIVHVQFNSWHYSDANLWASLMTNIFDGLKQYSTDNKLGELGTLFSRLHSTKELNDHKIAEKKQTANRIKDLINQQSGLDAKIKESTETLSNLTLKDYTVIISAEPEIKKELDDLKAVLTKELPDDEKIKAAVNELKDTSGKFKETAKLVYLGKTGPAIVIAIVIFIILLAGIWLINRHINAITGIFGFVASILSPLAFYGRGVYNKIKYALKRFNQTYSQLQEKAKSKFALEQESLKKQIDEAIAEQEKKDKELKDLADRRIQLENDLADIYSGKKILQFVESRVTDIRYTSGLGIISWIRKDFEQLNFLLMQQQSQPLKRVTKKRKSVYQVERIVLYIDDLDRCDEAIVVRVLEAIHLLLAFPLFVVVVGVDPRWMHNALNEKFGRLLDKKSEKKADDMESAFVEKPATTYDYLEKIFQVPFALKQIDVHGRNNLIAGQLIAKEVPEKEDKDPGAKPTEAENQNGKKQNKPQKKKEQDDQPASEKILTGPAASKQVPEQLLKIKKEEMIFMQAIGFMIGDSPRSVKRYINIYRIIRVHPRFKLRGQTVEEDYFSAMVLLAMLTSIPETAISLFDRIMKLDDVKEAEKPTLFKGFLKSFIADQKKEVALLNELSAQMSSDSVIKRLNSIEMMVLEANLDLIRRFSFRGMTRGGF